MRYFFCSMHVAMQYAATDAHTAYDRPMIRIVRCYPLVTPNGGIMDWDTTGDYDLFDGLADLSSQSDGASDCVHMEPAAVLDMLALTAEDTVDALLPPFPAMPPAHTAPPLSAHDATRAEHDAHAAGYEHNIFDATPADIQPADVDLLLQQHMLQYSS